MLQVNTTEFRRHLFDYLDNLEKHPLELTRGGEVVAQVIPVKNKQEQARERLAKLRQTIKLQDDLIKPIKVKWSYDEEHLT